jgi:hypothetical protein
MFRDRGEPGVPPQQIAHFLDHTRETVLDREHSCPRPVVVDLREDFLESIEAAGR